MGEDEVKRKQRSTLNIKEQIQSYQLTKTDLPQSKYQDGTPSQHAKNF